MKLSEFIEKYGDKKIDETKLSKIIVEEEKKYKVKCKITDLYLHHERLTTFDWVFGVDEKGYFTLKELEDLGINPEHYDLEEVE